MKIEYSKKMTLYIRLRDAGMYRSTKGLPDLDEHGHIVGLEILDASENSRLELVNITIENIDGKW